MDVAKILEVLKKPRDKRRGDFAMSFPYVDAAETLAEEVTRLRAVIGRAETLAINLKVNRRERERSRFREDMDRVQAGDAVNAVATEIARRLRVGTLGERTTWVDERDDSFNYGLRLTILREEPKTTG
jgi:wyosine [tRNA(Phe)-imidazoG37] synthetase (radical SAM superfamily)